MTRARRCGLVAAQAGCAACASAIACSTSECFAKATLAWTSPVLGLNTSANRPEPLTSLPPTKWPISRIVVLPSWLRPQRRGHASRWHSAALRRREACFPPQPRGPVGARERLGAAKYSRLKRVATVSHDTLRGRQPPHGHGLYRRPAVRFVRAAAALAPSSQAASASAAPTLYRRWAWLVFGRGSRSHRWCRGQLNRKPRRSSPMTECRSSAPSRRSISSRSASAPSSAPASSS